MSEAQKKFYLTTPIYYVNARPHIGHAYTTIAADVIARRQRLLLGDDNVWFLTGTDEHGQKVQRSAEAAGITPQQFTDQVSAQFEGLWKRMGITHNDYIRTTEPRHKQGVQKLFSELYSRGHIYLDTYTGQYSVGEEMFVDGPPGTIGPDGKPTETVTEENFYFRLSAYQAELIDRIEADEDDPKAFRIEPESRRNEVLSFLRGNVSSNIPAAQDGVILSEARSAESKDLHFSAKGTPYVPGALKDLSISRSSFDWGIPVPEPAASATKKKHVIYVWLDALANYMTAIGYGSDKPVDIAKLEKFWPADLHLVGKEIIRFHCVYWPAFLLAAGLPLPKKVQAHGWLLFEESKMSKSRGNIVRTETILDAFGSLLVTNGVSSRPAPSSRPEARSAAVEGSASLPPKHDQDLFASDVLRYFLLREIPFGQDGSFSFDALVQRYNSDLANGYGNLVSRTLTMIQKYSSSQIPTAIKLEPNELPEHAQRYFFGFISGPGKWAFANETEKKDFQLRFSAGPLELGINQAFKNFDLARVVENPMWAISGTDSYLSSNAPWKMAEGIERDDVLYTSAESIRIITALLYPILPYSTSKVWEQLGLGDIEAAAKSGVLNNLQWGGLKPGTKLGPLGPIFPRAPKELIQVMTDAEQNTTATTQTAEPPASQSSEAASSAAVPVAETAAEASAPIAIDDFAKIDLRVARVLVAERIPKADKLLRLEVDLGTEKRQILSGIAQWYAPEDLIGRRIIIVANLAPRKMRGLESHGMLLAASHGEDGKPILATFADSDQIELGSRLK
ncbi:MAG: methionine--tRNA ligase subunit beta [Acidobacteria bacterium]|nr:methionine--tRNA ligase subunit beta [Acidobacteriota bacterium]